MNVFEKIHDRHEIIGNEIIAEKPEYLSGTFKRDLKYF
jgi:hypothetical protein